MLTSGPRVSGSAPDGDGPPGSELSRAVGPLVPSDAVDGDSGGDGDPVAPDEGEAVSADPLGLGAPDEPGTPVVGGGVGTGLSGDQGAHETPAADAMPSVASTIATAATTAMSAARPRDVPALAVAEAAASAASSPVNPGSLRRRECLPAARGAGLAGTMVWPWG